MVGEHLMAVFSMLRKHIPCPTLCKIQSEEKLQGFVNKCQNLSCVYAPTQAVMIRLCHPRESSWAFAVSLQKDEHGALKSWEQLTSDSLQREIPVSACSAPRLPSQASFSTTLLRALTTPLSKIPNLQSPLQSASSVVCSAHLAFVWWRWEGFGAN